MNELNQMLTDMDFKFFSSGEHGISLGHCVTNELTTASLAVIFNR